MKLNALAALATFLGPIACGVEHGTVETLAVRALPDGEVFKIGVLVDDTLPANVKANYTAAADLAESQLNAGLDRAGSDNAFDVIVASYGAGQAESVAIDLVNNQLVLGLVSDTNENTRAINTWNNLFVGTPPIDHDIPLTCYQCSSPRFNRSDETDLGFADPENWLFRTFFDAGFEAPLQARLVLRRQNSGDLNGDGHLKIVVYFEQEQSRMVQEIPPALDALHQGSHSIEFVSRTLPSTPESRAAEMGFIFDDMNGPNPEGRFPDVAVLAFQAQEGPVALANYTAHPLPPGMATRPPVQMNDNLRREHLLPALLAAGGEGVEGSSVLRVNNSMSGRIFRNAFVDATGQQPQMTASYLHDAVVTLAGAIAWAFHNGSTDPELIQANIFNVNDPTGRLIRPRPMDYEIMVRRIDQDQPVDYEGAASSDDLDVDGENYPDLVRWRILNGNFVEAQIFRCDPAHPSCAR